jgi:carbamoyltransferase
MVVLGINIGHDGVLSVVKNGEHIFSLAEERLNRIKVYRGFPFLALKYIIENKIVAASEVDRVVIPSAVFLKSWAFNCAFTLTENKTYYNYLHESKPDNFFMDDLDYLEIKSDEDCKKYVDDKLKKLLLDVGIKAPIEYIDHHLAHASAAYYASGFKHALSITMDGTGDLLSATVNICRDGKIEKISETSGKHSAGSLYSEVTRMCGFKMGKHEGKITGLAAHGDFQKYEDCFDKLLEVKNGKLFHVDPLWRKSIRTLLNAAGFKKPDRSLLLLKRCGELSNKDLAASIQRLLEKKIVEIVSYWVNKTGIQDVTLSGGLFANVKFNQYISEIPDLDNLFIFPDMSDGGNAYGAAAYSYFKENKLNPIKTKNVYLGPEFENEYIANMLIENNNTVEYFLSDDVCKDTANLLSENKIIGWFQGRMEYGPRALGNRSIIASPVDATINKWLNDRMKRTEFMPFAPSCLYEYADELFDIPKKSMKYPAQFMTITFRMKKEWADRAPAVSHVDQTARPQLVTKEGNPKYHKLLKEYHKITGLPLFINTSFNVHEEPIVCTPEEGLNSLLTGVIDYFCVGDYICKLK